MIKEIIVDIIKNGGDKHNECSFYDLSTFKMFVLIKNHAIIA